jgi:hypothetical protein
MTIRLAKKIMKGRNRYSVGRTLAAFRRVARFYRCGGWQVQVFAWTIEIPKSMIH